MREFADLGDRTVLLSMFVFVVVAALALFFGLGRAMSEAAFSLSSDTEISSLVRFVPRGLRVDVAVCAPFSGSS